MDSENRVVVLIDMDCFYCQVEEKLHPELSGKPIAVVQYNPWKGGGIIAVNYVARAMGVTRHMRGDEAKAKCPEINLPSVPCSRGKADITKYRDAGKDVAKVLQKFTSLLERASIDEAYLDITAPVEQRLNSQSVHSISTDMLPNTYALGYDGVHDFLTDVHNGGSDSIEFDYENAKRLLVGAVIVNEIRTAVYEETGYQCSAGIAHNKILAKLVCGMNKPNKQTVLTKHSIDVLYKTLPLKKVKHLGGKFGDTVCQVLRITTMAELQMFSEKELQNKFEEKNGMWLYNIARGVDLEPVQARFNPKSIGCCKQFRGKSALLDLDSVRKWLKDLGDEIEDRLEKDALESNRTPKQMVVSYSTRLNDGKDTSSSRSYNFTAEDELCGDFFSTKAFELLMESSGVKHNIVKENESNRRLKAPIEFLGISVGKFQDKADEKKTKKINEYFGAGSKVMIEKPKDIEKGNVDQKNSKKDNDKDFILRRFFQTSEKGKEKIDPNVIPDGHLPVFESALDKQESFFAKMLNKKHDSDGKSIESGSSHHNKAAKPNTPVCEVIDCGEDSVDTEYSGSTINMEINKSIALFEDDPNEVDRIDNIRQLLNNSTKQPDNEKDNSSDSEANKPSVNNSDIQENSNKLKLFNNDAVTFKCSECMKTIPITLVEIHADYHLALKLRDEEREHVRKEIRENRPTVNNDRKGKPPEIQKKVPIREDKKSKSEEPSTKNDKPPSVTSFLVKLDDTIPTNICSKCGQKIAIEKLSEHLDFHEAQKLSKELNGKPAVLPSTQKRKRKSTAPTKKSKIPNCKSIDSYFK